VGQAGGAPALVLGLGWGEGRLRGVFFEASLTDGDSARVRLFEQVGSSDGGDDYRFTSICG